MGVKWGVRRAMGCLRCPHCKKYVFLEIKTEQQVVKELEGKE